MFVAVMSSENYEWVGLGNTEEEAKRSILKKWNKSGCDRMTLKGLDEYYGIWVEEIKPGECVRW